MKTKKNKKKEKKKMKKKDNVKKKNKKDLTNKEQTTVLVTVGSTQFEELIKVVDTLEFGEIIKALGYDKIIIQYGGKAKYIPHILGAIVNVQQDGTETKLPSSVEYIAMTDRFLTLLQQCSLVIGHAGT